MSLSFSDAGIEHLKKWEGVELQAYQDTGDVWTIGVGHTSGVTEGMTITEDQADSLLREDIGWAKSVVNRYVKVPITQSQYDTLVSFAFNVGEDQFRTSTLLRKLNAGDYDAVPRQLLRWVYDNGEYIQGLKNRRIAEAAMWNETPVEMPETAKPERRPGRVEPDKGPKVKDVVKEDGGIQAVLMAIAGAIMAAFQSVMEWLSVGGDMIREANRNLGPWNSLLDVLGANGVALALGVTIVAGVAAVAKLVRDRKEGA